MDWVRLVRFTPFYLPRRLSMARTRWLTAWRLILMCSAAALMPT